jgi:hypothetical protein
VDTFLEKRFAAGDFDEWGGSLKDPGKHFLYFHRLAFIEGVCGIAPGASKMASSKAYEDAGQAGACGLTLNGVEDLVDE